MRPMEIASLAVISFILTGLVQYLKKQVPVHALLILAGLSFVGASIYVILSGAGYWETVWEYMLIIASTANLIFNVFKAFYEGLGGDDSNT